MLGRICYVVGLDGTGPLGKKTSILILISIRAKLWPFPGNGNEGEDKTCEIIGTFFASFIGVKEGGRMKRWSCSG